MTQSQLIVEKNPSNSEYIFNFNYNLKKMIIQKHSGNSPAYINKILKKKQMKREFDIHKEKLLNVKAQTDTSQPLSLKFPLLRSKKRQ